MELSSLFLAGKGSALTSFFSTAFLVVFLPFCLVVYSLMPRRGKKYFLLAADCAFFWLISGKLLVYLLLDFLNDILPAGIDAADTQHVVRAVRAVRKRLALRDRVAVGDQNAGGVRQVVRDGLAVDRVRDRDRIDGGHCFAAA